MLQSAFGRINALLILVIVSASCANGTSPSSSSPTAPVPTASRAAVIISSVVAAGERSPSGGYVYRVVVRLRETAGVAARVDAVDLTMLAGTTVLFSSRSDQLLPGSANVIAANGVAETREIVVNDPDPVRSYASTVSAVVVYSDGVSSQLSASVSAGIPPIPVASTYALSGTITDLGTSRALEGVRVEVLNGSNAGKSSTSNSLGAYTLTGLAPEMLRMRASLAGYESGEQNVTVAGDTRADLALRKLVEPCNYTVAATNGTDGRGQLGMPWQGGPSSLTLTRTTGTCDWHANTDVSWITLGTASGNGGGLLPFTVGGNGLIPRTGVITVEWTGGRGQMTVFQGTPPDPFTVSSNTTGAPRTMSVDVNSTAARLTVNQLP